MNWLLQNWPLVKSPLVLDFMKPIVAALVGASVVALLGLRGFRRQKAIERRLDWYEKMHRQLGAVGRAFQLAAHYQSTGPAQVAAKASARAGRSMAELLELTDEAWMYANQRAFIAAQDLGAEIQSVRPAAHADWVSNEVAHKVVLICYKASNTIANELRDELHLPRVKPRNRGLREFMHTALGRHAARARGAPP